MQKSYIFSILILLSMALNGFSQEVIIKVKNPQEVKVEVSKRDLPEELEGLSWNRWTSTNFVVCSLNDGIAQYLHDHLESVKVWVFERWGMKNINFDKQVKLICVDDKKLFDDLFGIKESKVEIRKNEDGTLKEIVVFMLTDDLPSKTIPEPISELCIKYFALNHNTHFDLWAVKGMSKLAMPLDDIKEDILYFKKFNDLNKTLFRVNDILNVSEEVYKSSDAETRKYFDSNAVMFFLFIRKEFGEHAFLEFLRLESEKGPLEACKNLGFSSVEEMSKSYDRYVFDISREVYNGNIDPEYIQISKKNN